MGHQVNFHISKMASRISLHLELKERIDYKDDKDDPELKEKPKKRRNLKLHMDKKLYPVEVSHNEVFGTKKNV